MQSTFTAITRLILLFVVAALVPAAPISAQAGAAAGPAAKRMPVVVELFSSEGCSSCPPADNLLKRLETTQPIPGAEVIAIEEHVDYWNHDGWVDPFSSASWTFRQQEYVAKLKVSTEFTPEIVVDGQAQTDGNDMLDTIVLITKAARQPQAEVAIAPETSGGKDTQDFSVSVGKLAGVAPGDTADIWLAVTEDDLHSNVGAGENAGHELYHAAVLRSLKKIGTANEGGNAAAFSGDPRVKFNSHWKRENLHVVVFAQDKRSLKILGAAETRVSPARQD